MPSAEKDIKQKARDKEEAETLAERTRKLVNEGRTKVPLKEISERVDNVHRWSGSVYSSIVKQDKVFAYSRLESKLGWWKMRGLDLLVWKLSTISFKQKKTGWMENFRKVWRPTDKYVEHTGKLDRKHCMLSMEVLTGHIYLQYVLHKRKTAKACLYKKYSACSVWMSCIEKGPSTDPGMVQRGKKLTNGPLQIQIRGTGQWISRSGSLECTLEATSSYLKKRN